MQRPNNTATILVTTAIGVIAISVAVYYGVRAGTNDAVEAIVGDVGSVEVVPTDQGLAPTTTVPVNQLNQADLEAMSASEFIRLDDAVRLNAYGPKLDQWRGGAYDILYKYMSAEERPLVANNLPTDKASFSDQQILAQYAMDVFDASSQGSEPEKIDQGRKLLSVVMSPDNPRFEENSDISGGAEGAIKAVREAGFDHPRLTNVTFRGHAIGSGGAEIIRYTTPSGRDGVSLFTLLQTPEGNSIWQYTDEYFYTDPTIDADINAAVSASR